MSNVVTLSDESLKVVENYAKQQELGKGEAADKLIAVAKGRINALKTYAKRVASGEVKPASLQKAKKPAAKKATPKVKAAPKAKKPAAKKAPKAKPAKEPAAEKAPETATPHVAAA